MTMTKRKHKKSVSSTSPEVLDHVLKLSEIDVLKLSRYDSDQRAALNELALLQLRRTHFLQQVDPRGVLAAFDREIAQAKAAMQEAEAAGRAVREEVEARLKINLADYAFDDKTGILHQVTSAPDAAKET